MAFCRSIADLLDTYTNCISLLKAFRHRREGGDTGRAQNKQVRLRRSLKSDRNKIYRAYSSRVHESGSRFKKGDARAVSAVDRILASLKNAITNLLRTSRSEKPDLDYDSLMALSNASRVEAIKAIDSLSRRLGSQSRSSLNSSSSKTSSNRSTTSSSRRKRRSRSRSRSRSDNDHPPLKAIEEGVSQPKESPSSRKALPPPVSAEEPLIKRASTHPAPSTTRLSKKSSSYAALSTSPSNKKAVFELAPSSVTGLKRRVSSPTPFAAPSDRKVPSLAAPPRRRVSSSGAPSMASSSKKSSQPEIPPAAPLQPPALSATPSSSSPPPPPTISVTPSPPPREPSPPPKPSEQVGLSPHSHLPLHLRTQSNSPKPGNRISMMSFASGSTKLGEIPQKKWRSAYMSTADSESFRSDEYNVKPTFPLKPYTVEVKEKKFWGSLFGRKKDD